MRIGNALGKAFGSVALVLAPMIAYGQTDKPADKTASLKSPTAVSQIFKKTNQVTKGGDEKQKVRYDRIKNLRERSDYIGSLQKQARNLSKDGKVVGLMIATTPEQEKTYSAEKYKNAIEKYLSEKGVDVEILIAPNNAHIGSMFSIYVEGRNSGGGGLDKLKKKFLDSVAEAQISVERLSKEKTRTAIGGLNFTNN